MHTSSAAHPDAERAGYRHEALLYAGLDGFLDGVVPFLRDGARAGDPMLVVVDAGKIAALREALGADAGAVEFADMAEVGANPARIIPAWQDFLDRHEGRTVRGVGEPIHPGREGEELVECHRHEALLNLAFADHPGFWLVCPYDTTALHEAVVVEACRNHPAIAVDGSTVASDSFPGLEAFALPFADPLPEPAEVDAEFAFDADGLAALRAVVADRAAGLGVRRDRIHDVVLAVAELAANSIRHGGGSGALRLWVQDRVLICEIRDRGRFDDPLAGRRRPGAAQTDGRGLFIANQLCDLVQVRSTPHLSVVRVHVRL